MATDPKQVQNIKDTVERVKRKIRITKVVATRAVKTKRGDFSHAATTRNAPGL